MIHFNFPEGYNLHVYYGIISIPGNLWLISLEDEDRSQGLLSVDLNGTSRFSEFCSFYVWGTKDNSIIGFNSSHEGKANEKAGELGISLWDSRRLSYEGKVIENGKFCSSQYLSIGINYHIDIDPKAYFSIPLHVHGDYEKRLLGLLLGENPGITFWHKDYGFKSINPDPSKHWIFSCLSVDGLTCLAVHSKGGCIFDSPFFS